MATTGITIEDVKALFDTTTIPEDLDISWAVRDANVLVGDLLVPAGVSSSRRDMVAKYLAAHFVTLNVERGGLMSDRTGDASQTYMDRGYLTGLRSTRYGDMAVALDPSGLIAGLDATSKFGMAEFRVV